MINLFAIGFCYSQSWDIVYGERSPVLQWVTQKSGDYVFSEMYPSKELMNTWLDYYTSEYAPVRIIRLKKDVTYDGI